MKQSDKTRYWSKVNKRAKHKCWEWLGKARCGKSGLYGQFWLDGKNATPHRVGYELEYGEFDKTLHVLHKCDNPICVNPAHLFLGTNEDNIRDKMSKGRWKGGHPPFIPGECARCKVIGRIVRGHCKSCYGYLYRRGLI